MRPVSPGEYNFSILKRDQAMVGNGHSMGIAAKVFEDMFRTAEWALAVDDPIVAIEIANEVFKHLWIGQVLQLAVKLNLPFGEGFSEGVFNFPSKDFSESPFWQEKPIAWICWNPALMIERQTAGRNDTVYMGMVLQPLCPGMEHAEKADFSSQKFGIAGDFNQRFSAKAQQHRVDELLILQCNLSQEPRHCKDNMRVRNRKKLSLSLLDPTNANICLAFWAMPVST